VFRMTEDTTMAAPSRECARFTPQPSQTVDERLAALEDAVACSTASDPFASFRNLPFGRENTYRFGLSASQALFTGGRLGGQSQAADAGLRGAELGVTAARAATLLDVAAAYYDATLGDRLVGIARARVTRDNQRPIVFNAASSATWRTSGCGSCSTCRRASRSPSPPSWVTQRCPAVEPVADTRGEGVVYRRMAERTRDPQRRERFTAAGGRGPIRSPGRS
jgi:hypothetical protein